MDWLKDILIQALPPAIWGLVVYALGSKALARFDLSIQRALLRLRRIGPAEFDQLQPPQSEGEPKELIPSAPSSSLAAPDSMVGRYEAPIRTWVTSLPQAQREEELVRSLVNWQIGWNFETTNYSILGSQLQLLGSLNSQQLTLVQVRGYYDHAASAFPEYYANHPFDNWFGWLVSTVRLVGVEHDNAYITEDGREFAKYLISRGYPLSRFG